MLRGLLPGLKEPELTPYGFTGTVGGEPHKGTALFPISSQCTHSVKVKKRKCCLVVSDFASVYGIPQARIPGVGCHSLLQGIFLTQGSNPGLLHCMQILYHLNHQA